MKILLFALVLAACSPSAPGETASFAAHRPAPTAVIPLAAWTVDGDAAAAQFAWSVDGAGDVNGDGYDDVIVGSRRASHPSNFEGRAALYLGSAAGLQTTPVWTWEPDVEDSYAGAAVAGVGDINGDGFDDIAVGSPHWDSLAGADAGRVDLFFGGASGPSAAPDWTDQSGVAGAREGEAVAAAGDVNDDGFADMLVGAPGQDGIAGPGVGAVMILFGGPGPLAAGFGWTVGGGQAGEELGGAVAGLGDVTGDGVDDFGAGAVSYEQPAGTVVGAVAIYAGQAGGLPAGSELRLGSAHNEGFGASLAGLGDLNGDGFADLAVGAPGYQVVSGEGGIHVFLGTSAGLAAAPAWTLTPSGIDAELGSSVAGLGDINGDGYPDLGGGASLWEASSSTTNEGRYLVWLGGPGAPRLAMDIHPGQAQARMGLSSAGAGDVDGDGFGDVLVGLPLFPGPAGSSSGQLRIFRGSGDLPRTAAAPADEHAAFGAFWSQEGLAPGWGLGWDLVLPGDVDGDGFDDALVSAPTQADGGALYLYFGGPEGMGSVPWTWSSPRADAQAGYSVSGGDLDGDGYADLVYGAPFDAGPAGLAEQGSVGVFYGGPAFAPTAPDQEFFGGAAGAQLGLDLAVAGDLNADGFLDLAVGAPGADVAFGDEGEVRLWFGAFSGLGTAPSQTLSGDQLGEGFGAAVAGAGDTDGDGFDDLLVGAPDWSDVAVSGIGNGWAGCFLGEASGVGPAAVGVTTGDASLQRHGAALSGLGDVDGDGFGDVAVGRPAAGSGAQGEVLLYRGTFVGPSTTPAWSTVGAALARLGSTVVGLGDVDGDGRPELGLGAWGERPTATSQVDAGAAFIASDAGLYPAAASAWDLPWTRPSGQDGARYGWALAGRGDVNGDGFADLLVGAPRWDPIDPSNHDDSGAAFLYLGDAFDGELPLAPRRPRFVDPQDGAPVTPGRRIGGAAVEVSLLGRAPGGPARARIEVEAKVDPAPFDGQGLVVGPWTRLDSSGAELSLLVSGLDPEEGYRLRARLALDPAHGLPFDQGRWFKLGEPGRLGLRTACLADLDGDRLCDGSDPDADADGDPAVTDCDDLDPTRYTGAAEACDAVDSDCNGSLVDGFDDSDGDGIPDCVDEDDDGDGDPDTSDCAPLDPAVHAGAAEGCDGLDTDCDGVLPVGEEDGDGDGVLACGGDCAPADPAIHPGAEELCDGIDNDCSGAADDADVNADGILDCDDSDRDGFSFSQGDCDDGSILVWPGFPVELCDGLDNDCDGVFPGEEDGDGDGFRVCDGDCDDGDAAAHPGAQEGAESTVDLNCDGVTGANVDGDPVGVADGDCDDSDPAIYPGAPERCDGVDDNCDGLFLLGELSDADGDGYLSCEDCSDAEPTVHQGAIESCNGLDDDCDGEVHADEADADGDGYRECEGDCDDNDPDIHPGRTEVCGDPVDDDCDGSTGVSDTDGDGVDNCSDCDDQRAAVHPSATEVCDGRDDNCDGVIDEGFDVDADGWTACLGDCDDGDPTVHPRAPAVCDDGLDNDCNPLTVATIDADGDGFVACPEDGSEPDCWEGNAAVHPGADEVCDFSDNNCDGVVDEGSDGDGDGQTPCAGDCADWDDRVWLGAPEFCDGVDNNCDAQVDEGCGDDDDTVDDDDSATGDDDDSALGDDDDSAIFEVVLPPGCICGLGSRPQPAWLLGGLLFLLRRRRLGKPAARRRG